MNPSQKLTDVGRGEHAKAGTLNHMVAALKRLIVGGHGIRVEVMGDQIRINAKRQLIPVGGGGTQADYTAASKILLEEYTDVVDYARGRVTGGADKGVFYIRNPDNDGWDAVNRLE